MDRRGFLGRLLAVPAAVVAAAKAPALLPNVLRSPYPTPAQEAAAELFVGSFEIGEITRRSLKFPRRHGKSWPAPLIEARIEETVRNLGAHIDQVYTAGQSRKMRTHRKATVETAAITSYQRA